jgi:hypothetical protein
VICLTTNIQLRVKVMEKIFEASMGLCAMKPSGPMSRVKMGVNIE